MANDLLYKATLHLGASPQNKRSSLLYKIQTVGNRQHGAPAFATAAFSATPTSREGIGPRDHKAWVFLKEGLNDHMVIEVLLERNPLFGQRRKLPPPSHLAAAPEWPQRLL
jgi:hypothetical protein